MKCHPAVSLRWPRTSSAQLARSARGGRLLAGQYRCSDESYTGLSRSCAASALACGVSCSDAMSATTRCPSQPHGKAGGTNMKANTTVMRPAPRVQSRLEMVMRLRLHHIFLGTSRGGSRSDTERSAHANITGGACHQRFKRGE